jgi:hypothetical protein
VRGLPTFELHDPMDPTKDPGIGSARYSLATFRSDPLFPRIERVVATILEEGKVVRPVDVLMGMQLLGSRDLEAWRRGRVPYLEQVIKCNLTRVSRLLRILRFHVHDLKLVPSGTAYVRDGSGPKQPLRFTKTGDVKLEQAYATHFVWPGKGAFHPPGPRRPELTDRKASPCGCS